MEKQTKKKRFYKKGETVWVKGEKKEGKVLSINKAERTVKVLIKEGVVSETVKLNLWDIDKLKYLKKEKQTDRKAKKYTYFASVNGGTIPVKDKENAGRDCYARLEPVYREGKKVFEMHLPQLKLSKIPLGFASYLNLNDVLSLKHERSSIGSIGLINVSGLIDATYQGEVILQVVPLVADVIISSDVEEKYYDETLNTYFVPYGKAIAQAVTLKLSDAEDKHLEYDELLKKPSTRGTGGWGSTNK